MWFINISIYFKCYRTYLFFNTIFIYIYIFYVYNIYIFIYTICILYIYLYLKHCTWYFRISHAHIPFNDLQCFRLPFSRWPVISKNLAELEVELGNSIIWLPPPETKIASGKDQPRIFSKPNLCHWVVYGDSTDHMFPKVGKAGTI